MVRTPLIIALVMPTLSIPATTAKAQTTTCTQSPLGSTVTCHTTPGLNDNSGNNAAGWAALGRAMRERKERKRAQRAAEAAAALRSNVVELLKQGDCKGARQMSLESGAIDFAAEVSRYCESQGM